MNFTNLVWPFLIGIAGFAILVASAYYEGKGILRIEYAAFCRHLAFFIIVGATATGETPIIVTLGYVVFASAVLYNSHKHLLWAKLSLKLKTN